jgi:hypothetical protein
MGGPSAEKWHRSSPTCRRLVPAPDHPENLKWFYGTASITGFFLSPSSGQEEQSFTWSGAKDLSQVRKCCGKLSPNNSSKPTPLRGAA